MKKNATAFVAGVLFAVGLALAGMTKPSKVQAFLDLGGHWDPSLAFVMGGAVCVHFVAYRLIRRRPAPLFDTLFHVPSLNQIDARLVGGAAIFGVGWGLGGFCPGPAIVSAGSGMTSALVFVAAMVVGMGIERLFSRSPQEARAQS